ncbi:MAG TPA: hypothetical protein ENK07_00690, partial [Bacteroidetes bacterium]|nr:hypothetical protein [Bacteroidota bacterium]
RHGNLYRSAESQAQDPQLVHWPVYKTDLHVPTGKNEEIQKTRGAAVCRSTCFVGLAVFLLWAVVVLRPGKSFASEQHGSENLHAVVVPSPPAQGTNPFYTGNRQPLHPNPLIKLPVGSVEPGGWLRHWLELEADGFVGHLTEISKYCKYDGNAWVSPGGKGEHGWEEVPYWLRGFISLGYVLSDGRIIAEAERWIEGVFRTQGPDGFFGPRANWERAQVSHTTAHDIWPNMVMLYALRTYYEATGDERVPDLMLRYCRWLNKVPLENFLVGTWQHWRGGDNLDHIQWLYNQTGSKWLLDLGFVNHDQTAGWSWGIPTWHGVNLAQGFREPAEFYQQFQDPRYLKATDRNFHAFMDEYGQVPGGMFGADENARPGHTGPRQAAETCTMVEFMHSDEMLVGMTGDVRWADHAENVAFNSLPAAVTPDFKGLHYLTAPNLVQLDRKSKAPIFDNGGDMLSYTPWKYRCCQHNVSFGWPYLAEHLWMATRDSGLAAVFYSTSTVTATAGSGKTVKIREETSYPFEETIRFSVITKEPTKFPLYLRVPGWAKDARVNVNGKRLDVEPRAGSWLALRRTWRNGDRVVLTLPMSVIIEKWAKNGNSASVRYGPLYFSLKIGEKWVRYGGTDKWPAYEVFPTTPWNYALVLPQNHPEKAFRVVRKKGELPAQPFTPDNAPIIIQCKAKRVPGWGLEENGLIQQVPASPLKLKTPVETVTLVPMGCARLRVSAFPWVVE